MLSKMLLKHKPEQQGKYFICHCFAQGAVDPPLPELMVTASSAK
jgi:hypothetical protein